MKEFAAILLVVWGLSRLAISCGWIPPSVCPISTSGLTSTGAINWFVNAEFKQNFLYWFSGNRALAKNAKVVFHWEEPLMVGSTVSFTVQVFSLFLRFIILLS